MNLLDDFRDIVKRDEILAPHTYFRLGGPAEYFARPRTVEELQALVTRCTDNDIPMRVLGGGCNVLIRDEGVPGVTVRLDTEEFIRIKITDNIVEMGAGTEISAAITASTKANLTGLDVLVGIPGTIGGALRTNAGGKSGDIGQRACEVTVMDSKAGIQVRTSEDLVFSYRQSNLDTPVILGGKFDLEEDSPESIVKRMRRIWIAKKTSQPMAAQAAGCIFKNPRGLSAGMLIEQCGLKETKVGAAEVSERHANYIIANPGCTTKDVLQLIDVVKNKVSERFNVDLDLEIQLW